jgi:hypothetical protein
LLSSTKMMYTCFGVYPFAPQDSSIQPFFAWYNPPVTTICLPFTGLTSSCFRTILNSRKLK